MKKIWLLTLSIILLAWCGQTKISKDTNLSNTWNETVKNKTTISSWTTTKIIKNLKDVNDSDTKEILNIMHGLLK